MAERLYEHAGNVIEDILKKKGTIKSLCFNNHYRNKRKLYALVLETFKHKKVIETILSRVHITSEELKEKHSLKLALTYETLFGKGIPKNCRFHDAFIPHNDDLLETLHEVSRELPELLRRREGPQICIPRYVRVNTLKISLEEATNVFQQNGFSLVETSDYLNLDEGEFTNDSHIPNLLVFHESTDFHKFVLYKEGKIILQDKASCLPAFILNPPKGSLIIDGCAAPGNKSSHLAAIIMNEGVIHSFDLNNGRLETMRELMKKCGANSVKPQHRDFLSVKHTDRIFSNVEYILLDPSCSGSGIMSRMDELVDEDKPKEQRLKSLSGFQTAALSHALQFPRVKRVIYSTCSRYKEENEDVVGKACKRFESTFRLVHILPSWKNRGIGDCNLAKCCIRAVPEDDKTNGFFVAMFERINPTDCNIHSGTQQDVSESLEGCTKSVNEQKVTEHHRRRKRKRERPIHDLKNITIAKGPNKFSRKVSTNKSNSKKRKKPII